MISYLSLIDNYDNFKPIQVVKNLQTPGTALRRTHMHFKAKIKNRNKTAYNI